MTGAKGFFGRAGAFLRERPILTAGFAAGAVRSGVRSGDVEIWSHRPARGDETVSYTHLTLPTNREV